MEVYLILTYSNLLPIIDVSTTPPGSPPPNVQNILQGLNAPAAAPVQPPAPAPSTTSILAALANMARQNNVATPAPPPPVVQAPSVLPPAQPVNQPYTLPTAQVAPPSFPPQSNATQPFQYPQMPALPVNLPVPQATPQPQVNGAPSYGNNIPAPFAAIPPVQSAMTPAPAMDPRVAAAKALLDYGLDTDQITAILNSFSTPGLAGLPPPPPPPQPVQQSQNTWNGNDARDRYDGMRSPQGHDRRRSRSPSPRGWNYRNRRDDDVNDFRNGGRNQFDDRRGYRERSPQRRTPTPPRGGGEKWIGWDQSIGRGNIKGR